MPTTINWIVEDRIVLYTNQHTLSVEELRDASERVAERIKQGSAPVHLIITTYGLEEYPIDITVIRNATIFFEEPNLGWVVHVGDNRLIRFLASAVARLADANLQNMDSYEDAITFLLGKDDSLDIKTIPEQLP